MRYKSIATLLFVSCFQDLTAMTSTTTTTTKTVAVLYATKGGMGDVGKFVMTLARLEPSCTIRPIALSVENSREGTDKGLHVDVTDPALKTTTEDVLATMVDSIRKIDVASDSAEKEIGDAIAGVDAVISCLGNREPSMERWCALGTRKVVNAMTAQNIQRLVCLSSMGIGTDFLKTTPLTVLWAVLLRTLLRSARKDLYGLETVVRESGLDFVLVRPVGLTPQQPPQGSSIASCPTPPRERKTRASNLCWPSPMPRHSCSARHWLPPSTTERSPSGTIRLLYQNQNQEAVRSDHHQAVSNLVSTSS